MATRDELIDALRKADAAGDEPAAKRFAELINAAPTESKDYKGLSGALDYYVPDAKQILGGVEAIGRTAVGIAGAIPQGIRGIGEAASGGLEGAFDRAGNSNFANMLPNASSAVSDMQENLGHVLSAPFEAAGRSAERQTGASPETIEWIRKTYGDKAAELAMNSQQLTRTGVEAISQFTPLPAVKGFKFKGKEKEIPGGDLRSRVDEALKDVLTPENIDAVIAERVKNYSDPYGPEAIRNTRAGYENAKRLEAEAQVRPDVIQMSDRMNDPTLPRIDPALIARGAEIERPLPQIIDPAILEAQKAQRGTPEPLRDPLMEMDPRQNMERPMGPPRPAPEAPALTTELGAAKAPDVPATEALATNHTAPTIDFPLKTDVLSKEPMAQELLRRLEAREAAAEKGGKAGAEAKKEAEGIREILQDWGWKGWETKEKPSLYQSGGETLAPIEKTSGFGFAGSRMAPGAKPTGKQGGSTAPLGDSPVLKMVNNALKKFSAGKESVPAFQAVVDTKAATEALPGVGKAFNGIDMVPDKPAEVLTKFADSLDPSKDFTPHELRTGLLTSSGANMKAKSTNNPFVKATYQYTDAAVKAAGVMKKQFVEPLLKEFKSLTKQEYTDLNYVMRKAEGVKDWTPQELANLGLNDKQIRVYELDRQATKAALDHENAARAMRGENPIPYRPGYMASTFTGHFRTLVRDSKTGQVVNVLSDDTRGRHDKLVELFKEKVGKDYTFEPLEPFKNSTFKNRDAAINYAHQQYMKELIAGDPRAAALESLHQQLKDQAAEIYKGQNQHMKAKSNQAVGGAEGLRFELSNEQNALRGFKAHYQSLENAFLWSEHQKAYSKVGELLKATQETLPRASEYISAYRDQSIGRRTNALGKISDLIVDSLGKDFGPAYAEKASSYVKAGLNAKLLGGPTNLSFAALQMLQVLNAFPEMLSVKGRTGASTLNLVEALTKSTVDSIKPTSKRMQEALEWGQKNDVIRAVHWDDVGDIGNAALTNVGKVWNGVIKAADAGSRRLVYMGFVNLLKDKYHGEALYRMAADATERSMTDYRGFETPMAFQSGGVLGRNAMFLHKYPANFINQLSGFAKNKEYAPLISLIGTNFFTAGMVGMIGIQQMDQIVNAWNSVFAEHGYKMPSPKEAILKMKAPDWATFGPVSAATNLDMSSRASMANLTPDNPADALLPGVGDMGRVLGAIPGAVMGNPQKLVHEALPSSLKVLSEEAFYSKPGENGKTDFTNPNRPQLKNHRSDFDRAMRGIGGRSLEETKENTADYIDKSTKANDAALRTRIIERYVSDMAKTSNPMAQRKLGDEVVKKYMDLGGNPEHLAADVEKARIASQTTYGERQALGAENNPQNYLRYKELRP